MWEVMNPHCEQESSDEVAQPISLIQSMGRGFYTNGGVEPKRVVENTSQSVLYLCEKLKNIAYKMVKTLDDNLSFWKELGIKDRQKRRWASALRGYRNASEP